MFVITAAQDDAASTSNTTAVVKRKAASQPQHCEAKKTRCDNANILTLSYYYYYYYISVFIVIILAYVENSVWSSVVYVYFTAAASPVDSRQKPCDNCGAFVTVNGGLCRRCLDLPYCFRCKRHLPTWCYDDEQSSICQVVISQIGLLVFARHIRYHFSFVDRLQLGL